LYESFFLGGRGGDRGRGGRGGGRGKLKYLSIN